MSTGYAMGLELFLPDIHNNINSSLRLFGNLEFTENVIIYRKIVGGKKGGR